ncbi:MAG: hypothetical protein AAFY20_25045 [Cyanobacteria bacterium J06639_14]
MASSPYRSKVLQFVVVQAQRVQRQATQTWRQTRLATMWGVQITAAIAHGIWQWSQSGWHQVLPMAQGVASSWSKLTAAVRPAMSAPSIPTDTPIRHVLAWVAAEAPLAIAQPGLATDLATRRLVWVMADSTVIVDEAMHHQLQARIVWELADYGYRQRQLQRRMPLISGFYPVSGARVLGWIWQAIAYFFGDKRVQTPSLPSQRRDIERAVVTRSARLIKRCQCLWPWGKMHLPLAMSPRQEVPVFAWIGQAIAYFFAGKAGPTPSLPGQTPPSDLAVTSELGTFITPFINQYQYIWQRGKALGYRLIDQWVGEIVNRFFAYKGNRCLAPDADVERTGALTNPTFALAILPGVWNWGHSVVVWVRQTVVRWLTGNNMMVWQQADRIPRLPASPSLQLLPSPEDVAFTVPYPQALIDSMATPSLTIPVMSTPSSATVAEPWLNVSATSMGYERSLLVWLLTVLDWVLVQLERCIVWLWQRFTALGNAIVRQIWKIL